ncbi:MAG TPA: pYEATS domain-containing protein [Nitrososphaera sp.]|jgi:transcription initiation factor IIF auxiliary subunit|nr:pYEATS domain-containing protein [Nitrososphaera sp.]
MYYVVCEYLLLGEDTLVKIMVRNTSQRLITHSSEQQQFQWSVFIETEPAQFRKEIKKVIYHLHPTFPNKDVMKTNESEGFVLTAHGWGEFIITIELVLYDNRRLSIEHYLSLFSKNRKMETIKTLFKNDFS